MINKVILVGRVGKDPDVRHLDNNASVARFSIATNESYKNKNGEKITNTEWHNIVAWRSQAEFAGKYIKKGTLLYIEGKIRTRSWDDKDGNKRYSTEIDVDSFQLLGPRVGDDGSGNTVGVTPQSSMTGSSSSGSPANEFIPDTDFSTGPEATDDLPF
jgi:single-strand DNA-binding protein